MENFILYLSGKHDWLKALKISFLNFAALSLIFPGIFLMPDFLNF
jgi:hypothetical protein